MYAALYVGYNGIRVTLGTGKLTMDTAANCPLRENAYRTFRVFLISLREWDLPTMWIFQTQEIITLLAHSSLWILEPEYRSITLCHFKEQFTVFKCFNLSG